MLANLNACMVKYTHRRNVEALRRHFAQVSASGIAYRVRHGWIAKDAVFAKAKAKLKEMREAA